MGYPLWLFPKQRNRLYFRRLKRFQLSVPYFELPLAKAFMESLERNSKTHEDYMAFLSDHTNYFQQPKKEKEFPLQRLNCRLEILKKSLAFTAKKP